MTEKERAKRDERGVRIQMYERYRAGEDYAELQADDLSPILNASIKELQQNGGRQTKYENSEAGMQAFINGTIEYLKYIDTANANKDQESKRLIPDYEGLWAFLGISRQTANSYEKERGEEWRDMMQKIKTMILSCKKQLAQTGKIPPMIAVLDWVNNSGYVNTNEFKLQTEEQKPNDVPSIEAIQEKYKALPVSGGNNNNDNNKLPEAEF